jgi:hypothetical protein
VGTAAPTIFWDADPKGRWVVLCQARGDTNHDGVLGSIQGLHGTTLGDPMTLYLVRGTGEGEAIDYFLGRDPTGRWLAIERGGAVDILDMERGTHLSLGRSEVPRSVDFSPDGKAVIPVSSQDSGEAAVDLLDLEAQRSTRLPLGKGVVWTASFAGSGSWIFADVITSDTNGDGKITVPAAALRREPGRCGPAIGYNTRNIDESDDRVTRVVVPTRGGTPLTREGALRGLLFPFGDRLLIERERSRVVALDVEGRETELVPADADGWIVDAGWQYNSLLLFCGGWSGARRRLVAFREGRRQELPIAVTEHMPAIHAAEEGRIAKVLPGGDREVLFDRKTWRTIELAKREHLCASNGPRAYLDVEGTTELVDLETGARTKLHHEPCTAIPQATAWVLSGKALINATRGRVVGSFERVCQPRDCQWAGGALAVSQDGALLLFPPAEPLREALIRWMLRADPDLLLWRRGPLEWIRAGPGATR